VCRRFFDREAARPMRHNFRLANTQPILHTCCHGGTLTTCA
jgi:hypothetical protein